MAAKTDRPGPAVAYDAQPCADLVDRLARVYTWALTDRMIQRPASETNPIPPTEASLCNDDDIRPARRA